MQHELLCYIDGSRICRSYHNLVDNRYLNLGFICMKATQAWGVVTDHSSMFVQVYSHRQCCIHRHCHASFPALNHNISAWIRYISSSKLSHYSHTAGRFELLSVIVGIQNTPLGFRPNIACMWFCMNNLIYSSDTTCLYRSRGIMSSPSIGAVIPKCCGASVLTGRTCAWSIEYLIWIRVSQAFSFTSWAFKLDIYTHVLHCVLYHGNIWCKHVTYRCNYII